MSQPTGFYRKKNAQGEVTTRPIIASGGSDYVEPEMQIQAVRHQEDPMKQLLRLGIEGGEKVDAMMSEKVKEYRATHTPEALLLKEEAKVRVEEDRQLMDERREEIFLRQQQLEAERVAFAERKRQEKQAKIDKAFQEK